MAVAVAALLLNGRKVRGQKPFPRRCTTVRGSISGAFLKFPFIFQTLLPYREENGISVFFGSKRKKSLFFRRAVMACSFTLQPKREHQEQQRDFPHSVNWSESIRSSYKLSRSHFVWGFFFLKKILWKSGWFARIQIARNIGRSTKHWPGVDAD